MFGAVGLGKDVTFGCDARDAAGFVPVGVARSHSAGLVGGAESALPRVVAAEFLAGDFHEGCGRSRCTRSFRGSLLQNIYLVHDDEGRAKGTLSYSRSRRGTLFAPRRNFTPFLVGELCET